MSSLYTVPNIVYLLNPVFNLLWSHCNLPWCKFTYHSPKKKKNWLFFLLDNSLGFCGLFLFFKFLLSIYPVSLLVQKETNHKISESIDNFCERPPKTQNLLWAIFLTWNNTFIDIIHSITHSFFIHSIIHSFIQ